MRVSLEVQLSDEAYGETVRGQLIQSGVNGMNSGAITGFEISEGHASQVAARDAAAIRWAIEHVVRVLPHASPEALAEALEKAASAVETLQVRVS